MKKILFSFSSGSYFLLINISVNGSGQFVGVTKMVSEVNFTEKFAQWTQEGKWMGKFKVEWLYIKDIPNREFKSIIVPTNENKPVTNTRDAQEVPYAQGMTMLKIFNGYTSDVCLLHEFEHYDNEELKRKETKVPSVESFGKINYDASGRGRRYQGRRGSGRGRGRRGQDSGRESHEAAKGEASTKPVATSAAPVAGPIVAQATGSAPVKATNA